MVKRKRPWIGGLGVVLIIVGLFALMSGSYAVPCIIMAAGAGLLVYAMATGNLTFWG